MTEEELSLFSEFLEQKEYARGNVAGMNPNMIRRRVVNGKTVTKVSKSTGGKSAKQVIRNRAEKAVAANAPKPEYKSEGFRTVETEGSKAARKDYQHNFQKNVNKEASKIRKSVRDNDKYRYRSSDKVVGYETGNINTVINNKQYVIDAAPTKDDGWSYFYKSGNKDHDRNLSALRVINPSGRYAKHQDYNSSPGHSIDSFKFAKEHQ